MSVILDFDKKNLEYRILEDEISTKQTNQLKGFCNVLNRLYLSLPVSEQDQHAPLLHYPINTSILILWSSWFLLLNNASLDVC